MTPHELRIYSLMKRVIWLLHNGKCFLSGQVLEDPVTHDQGHPWEAHHILHQRQHPHMRFDLDNVVPLAKRVHDLDQQGELNHRIRYKMGDEKYNELTRRAHVITSVDLHAIQRRFNEIISRGQR